MARRRQQQAPDRVGDLERQMARLEASQNTIFRPLLRRYQKSLGREHVIQQREMDSRLQAGGLNGVGWPTRSQAPAGPDAVSMPLTARMTDTAYFSEGQGAAIFDPDVATVLTDLYYGGVRNGLFLQPPPDAGARITNVNPIPYWVGPTVVSGTGITVTHLGPSQLRFDMAAGGSVGDEVYFEQYLPLVGGLARAFGDYVRARFEAVTSFAPVDGEGKLELVYVDEFRVPTGNVTSMTINGTALTPQTLSAYGHAQEDEMPPPDARELRVRISARRRATSGVATYITFNEVRRVHAFEQLMLAELSVPDFWASGVMYQAFGEINISPNGGGSGTSRLRVGSDTISVEAVSGIYLGSAGGVTVVETTTPPLPATDEYVIYAKSDGNLYGQNDAGVERQLDSAGGGGGGTATRRFAFFAS